eukprot:TRINITY_DN3010_c0_g1_i1.p1 TRINITY_DN3010_c0_g1~~TRINITY_DN3010_c0_g1_i1.p1  ORF type:complete len:446 (+),score=79.59 TRINITY_DN3010_c0_g1_i1:130-1467(+)
MMANVPYDCIGGGRSAQAFSQTKLPEQRELTDRGTMPFGGNRGRSNIFEVDNKPTVPQDLLFESNFLGAIGCQTFIAQSNVFSNKENVPDVRRLEKTVESLRESFQRDSSLREQLHSENQNLAKSFETKLQNVFECLKNKINVVENEISTLRNDDRLERMRFEITTTINGRETELSEAILSKANSMIDQRAKEMCEEWQNSLTVTREKERNEMKQIFALETAEWKALMEQKYLEIMEKMATQSLLQQAEWRKDSEELQTKITSLENTITKQAEIIESQKKAMSELEAKIFERLNQNLEFSETRISNIEKNFRDEIQRRSSEVEEKCRLAISSSLQNPTLQVLHSSCQSKNYSPAKELVGAREPIIIPSSGSPSENFRYQQIESEEYDYTRPKCQPFVFQDVKPEPMEKDDSSMLIESTMIQSRNFESTDAKEVTLSSNITNFPSF